MVQTVSATQTSRLVATWLLFLYLMVFAMVIVGGATRLTGSGLSMVQWHPFMGALPPLSESDWTETFQKYQASPQYKLVNHWMLLSDFKRIFLWEYAHRLLGRLIGVFFIVPWLLFLVQRRLDRPLAWKTFVAFLLGGAQGLLGWFMVKSGLVDNPEVSHYRLAAHLGLALLVGQYLLWLFLDLRAPPAKRAPGQPEGTSGVPTWSQACGAGGSDLSRHERGVGSVVVT
ncbi:MAG: COX15/CtaA family protein [Deltaproteobacteria bacterium]|nr:COX15/CtaA family protein [Deltaproteobacteria bacterium]